MATKGLPGMEALFRDHIRLSKKLSTDELKAIRRYIGGRLSLEHDSLLFKIRSLKSAQELNEIEYQKTLGELQNELDKEKWLANEFQREFASLARVLQQRDVRFRLQHETLVNDLKKARKCLSEFDETKKRLDGKIKQKEDIIHELQVNANQLRDRQRKKIEILEQKCSEEKTVFRNEILKLKYVIDTKDKEISNLKADLYELKTEKHVSFVDSDKIKDGGCSCSSRNDLQQCRDQLVQKCKEITTLKYQIEQNRQKIREQNRLIGFMAPIEKEYNSSRRITATRTITFQPKFTRNLNIKR